MFIISLATFCRKGCVIPEMNGDSVVRVYKSFQTIFFLLTISHDQTESVVHRCSLKYVLLKISQYSQENTFIQKRLQHRGFPANFAKFLRTAFLQNTAGG